MLHQSDHTKKAVLRFSMEVAKPQRTPIQMNALEVGNSPKLYDRTLSQQYLGTINDITPYTRLNVAFANSYLAERPPNQL